jgi:hypothetical protein
MSTRVSMGLLRMAQIWFNNSCCRFQVDVIKVKVGINRYIVSVDNVFCLFVSDVAHLARALPALALFFSPCEKVRRTFS